MNYKIEKAIKKSKKYFGKFAILWLVLAIVFVLPVTITIVDATTVDGFSLENFITNISSNIMSIGTNLEKVFNKIYFAKFIKNLVLFTIVFFILMIIGIRKLKPKNEYENIEHGSSGWAERGEQYKVLSNKEGIILAEDNYLPLNKQGNVNVLIVGRFWCW